MAEQVGKSYLLGVKTTCSRSRKGMETEPEIPPRVLAHTLHVPKC